jgi:CubicO group peptidase (beta-lactamase class C family)
VIGQDREMTIWPAGEWRSGVPDGDVDQVGLDELFATAAAQPEHLGLTLAVAAVHRGVLVAEMYGPDTTADTTLISWSMAKSMTHTVIGLLIADGVLELDQPAPIAAWANDARRWITVRHLLDMSSGLEFVEDYVDAGVSHVIEMLFGAGAQDHAAYAAAMPLVHQPGSYWNYSSGTSNILARIAGDAVGGGQAGMERYLAERLFGPLGMASAIPKFDPAGTFVGSSFVYATARDFARFGYLYLRDGMWNGEQLIAQAWVGLARQPVPAGVGADETHGYGSHWWHWRHDPKVLMASGYETQRIIVEPARDLVIVRLGKTTAEFREPVDRWLDDVRQCFPDSTSRG